MTTKTVQKVSRHGVLERSGKESSQKDEPRMGVEAERWYGGNAPKMGTKKHLRVQGGCRPLTPGPPKTSRGSRPSTGVFGKVMGLGLGWPGCRGGFGWPG